MKKLILTDVQLHRINVALTEASGVLNEIKRKPLEGEALKNMKILEEAVVNIETFKIVAVR